MPLKSKPLAALDIAVIDLLAEVQRNSGVSQRQLARETGMSLNRVGIILRGEGPAPTVGELDALAEALGVLGSDLLREAEARLAAREVRARARERERAEVVQLGERRADWPEGLPPLEELAAQVEPGADEELAETTGWRDDLGEESQDIPYGEDESL